MTLSDKEKMVAIISNGIAVFRFYKKETVFQKILQCMILC